MFLLNNHAINYAKLFECNVWNENVIWAGFSFCSGILLKDRNCHLNLLA